MKKLLTRLRRDEKGLSAIEFSILAPALLLAIIGIAQLAILFFANAGLSNAVSEGARYATLYPQPSAADIKTKINAQRFGLDSQYLSAPVVTSGSDGTVDYLDLSMSYNVPLNFIFFTVQPVTLTQTRRAFVYKDLTPAA